MTRICVDAGPGGRLRNRMPGPRENKDCAGYSTSRTIARFAQELSNPAVTNRPLFFVCILQPHVTQPIWLPTVGAGGRTKFAQPRPYASTRRVTQLGHFEPQRS